MLTETNTPAAPTTRHYLQSKGREFQFTVDASDTVKVYGEAGSLFQSFEMTRSAARALWSRLRSEGYTSAGSATS